MTRSASGGIYIVSFFAPCLDAGDVLLLRVSVQVQEGWGFQAAIDEAAEILERDTELAEKATSVDVRLASPADLAELGLEASAAP